MKNEDLKFVLDILQEKKVLSSKISWYEIIGFVVFHRVETMFYNSLTKMKIRIPKQFERFFIEKKSINIEKNALKFKEILSIEKQLDNYKIQRAILKGPALSQLIYGLAERTSNDIDLLIAPESIDMVNKSLLNLGFVQGEYDSQTAQIIKFNRKQILERRMTRGETAPYFKLVNDSIVEVDVNFSLDYLPSGSETIISQMLNSTQMLNGMSALDNDDMFIHLLLHLYKESVLKSMIERNKDIELYKFVDIYRYFISDLLNVELLQKKILDYGFERQAYFILNRLGALFTALEQNQSLVQLLATLRLEIEKKEYMKNDKEILFDNATFFQRLANLNMEDTRNEI